MAVSRGQDMFLMRMRPIFSTSRSQSDAKKPDDDWQEQFFKLDVKYIVSEQVRARWLARCFHENVFSSWICKE